MVADVVARHAAPNVLREAVAGDDAHVLDGAVGVEQLGADHADMWLLEMGDHPFDPIRGERLDVVVEDQDEIAGGPRRAQVDLLGDVHTAGAS